MLQCPTKKRAGAPERRQKKGARVRQDMLGYGAALQEPWRVPEPAILNATSLGDPCSRIMARQEETDRGIPARYTRVSIGLEEADDLMADFKQAIEKC